MLPLGVVDKSVRQVPEKGVSVMNVNLPSESAVTLPSLNSAPLFSTDEKHFTLQAGQVNPMTIPATLFKDLD